MKSSRANRIESNNSQINDDAILKNLNNLSLDELRQILKDIDDCFFLNDLEKKQERANRIIQTVKVLQIVTILPAIITSMIGIARNLFYFGFYSEYTHLNRFGAMWSGWHDIKDEQSGRPFIRLTQITSGIANGFNYLPTKIAAYITGLYINTDDVIDPRLERIDEKYQSVSEKLGLGIYIKEKFISFLNKVCPFLQNKLTTAQGEKKEGKSTIAHLRQELRVKNITPSTHRSEREKSPLQKANEITNFYIRQKQQEDDILKYFALAYQSYKAVDWDYLKADMCGFGINECLREPEKFKHTAMIIGKGLCDGNENAQAASLLFEKLYKDGLNNGIFKEDIHTIINKCTDHPIESMEDFMRDIYKNNTKEMTCPGIFRPN